MLRQSHLAIGAGHDEGNRQPRYLDTGLADAVMHHATRERLSS